MKKYLNSHYQIILILFLAFLLRFFHYAQFPVMGETGDEVAWSMLGSSLIQTHQPSSWSWFDAYKDDYIVKTINHLSDNDQGLGAEYRLVSPVFDHPPLFSLIPGFFHNLKSSWDQVPSIKLIRFPMIFLGTINVWLLHLVASQLFKKRKTALTSTLIYATAPIFVIASRLVVAENLLITWLLLTIFLLKSKFKNKNNLLIIISACAILTKISGIIIPLGIILYGWQEHKKELIKNGCLGLFIGVGTYFLYGAIINWQLFVQVFLSQSNRQLGLMTFANRFFLHPTVVQKLFIDGWIVLGIFSLVAWLIVSHKNTKQIKIFTLLYLLFLVATVEEQTIHGWYHYPLFPIFSLSIAWFLDYITINKDYWIIWLSWIFVLPTIRMALVFSHTYNDLSNFALRSIMALGGLPLGLSLLKKQKLAKKYVTFLFLILILASIIAILTINARDYSETNQFFNFKIS